MAGAVVADQVGDVGVGNGDEVAARRIEGVEEQARLAGQRPALAREHLLAAVREVLEEREVLQQVALAVEFVEQARLVLGEPVHRLLEAVHGVQRVVARVRHDAHRVRARGQRNQPDPVARADQVVGREPARLRGAAGAPFGVVAPVVERDALADTEPHRMGVVRVRLGQAQLALEQAGAAAGVDDPARGDDVRLPVLRPAQAVQALRIVGKVDLPHHRVVGELHAAARRLFGQVVLEDAAVDLVAGHRQKAARADLGDPIDVAPAFAEEEAEAELAQLFAVHVRLQA
jgi:hypothetical protein